jgi:hypothetical protein
MIEMFFNRNPEKVVHHNRKHHQKNIGWFAPCIKNQTKCEQNNIFPSPWRKKITEEYQWKKEKQKNSATKNQDYHLICVRWLHPNVA